MRKPTDRDQSIARVLRHTLRRDTLDAAGPCPDAETVAAWAARALPAAVAATLEAHLSHCGRCQALLAVFARTEPEPVAAPSLWRRWRMAWLVPIASAATAVTIWVAVSDAPRPRSSEPFEIRRQDAGASSPSVATAPPAPSAQGTAQERAEADRDAPGATSATTASAALGRRPAPQDTSVAATSPREGATAEQRAAVADRVSPAEPPSAEPQPAERRAARAEAVQAPAAPVAAPAPARLDSALRATAPVRAAAEVVSPDPAVRWRIVADGLVERSTSGGASWEAASVTPPVALTAGSSPDPEVCWLVGPAGAVRLTTDGVRFRAVTFPEAIDLVSARATSARSAVVTAADGRVFRTDDQGATWTRVAP